MRFPQLVTLASQTVESTRRRLPAPLRSLAMALPVVYEAFPGEELIAEGIEHDVLGLFVGEPHGAAPSDNPLPAQVLLYLDNIWSLAEEDAEVFREEVRLTYLHELGHYLGWDEDEVAQRGLE